MEPSVLSRSRMTGKKTVNSRRIMAAVMVIVMLAALTGCVGKEDTQTRKKNKVVEIPMILTVDSSTGNKNEEEVVERFNRAYKGKYHIDVDWVMETEEEYRKNLKRMNVTDELPAIITDLRMLPSFYQMMIRKGRIEDLTPYINEDQEWNRSGKKMERFIWVRSARRHSPVQGFSGTGSYLNRQESADFLRHGRSSGNVVRN